MIATLPSFSTDAPSIAQRDATTALPSTPTSAPRSPCESSCLSLPPVHESQSEASETPDRPRESIKFA